MQLGLDGKVALVTGGSRGIGRAVARGLAAEGMRVALCGRRQDAVDAAASEIGEATGAEVIGIAADMGVRDSVVSLAAEVRDRLGAVAVLVNNAATAAGRSTPPALSEITRDAMVAEIDVKVLGYLFAAQQVAPGMRAAGWGRIINVGGLAAVLTGSTIGSIRNVAVAALTKNLADELGPSGITVNGIHPGYTRTSSDAGRPEPAPTNSIRTIVRDVDLAPVVAFLASPLSFPVNGQMIEVSGGTPGTIRY